MKKKIILRCTIALLGVFLISVGVAFNAMSRLGNDPVGIFYDGIRSALHLTESQLGMASNVVNILIILILIITGRKYINIGTVLYILPYGTFVNIGTSIYQLIFSQNILWSRILASVIGCIFISLGVAIYITMDIGLDPMTGVVMVIKDKLNWNFRKTKICFDILLLTIGFLMGGKLGVVTVITALLTGPSIQFIADRLYKKIKNE